MFCLFVTVECLAYDLLAVRKQLSLCLIEEVYTLIDNSSVLLIAVFRYSQMNSVSCEQKNWAEVIHINIDTCPSS